MTTLGSLVDGALNESTKPKAKKGRTVSKRDIAAAITAGLLIVGVSIAYAQGIFPGNQTTSTSVVGSTTATETATALSPTTTTITQTDQNTTVIEPAVLQFTSTITTTLPGGVVTTTTTVFTTNTTITTTTVTISCPQPPFCN